MAEQEAANDHSNSHEIVKTSRDASNGDVIIKQAPNSRWTLTREELRAHPKSLLGQLFSKKLEENLSDWSDEIEIPNVVSESCVETIIGFYKTGQLHCNSNTKYDELNEACQYFRIPFSTSIVRSSDLYSMLREISNLGATKMFTRFINTLMLPAINEVLQNGSREVFLIIWNDDDHVDWIGKMHPEKLNSSYLYVHIFSSEFVNFFRYHENRSISKDYLSQNGFSYNKVDISYFPLKKEMTQQKNNDDAEATYSYKQRPFIFVTWENKTVNRHVKFAESFNCTNS
ncbi:MAG: Dolichyl-diphosphooligosaccharide--protein glycosyltransferase subunit stt3b [Paramarteilia canceri]